MTITIVGLGPGDPDLLTVAAYRVLESSPRVYLRTRKHPTVALLEGWGKEIHTFDHLYEAEATFDVLYQAIAREILQLGAAGPVCYAVPGHPLVAEATVQTLIAQKEVPVRILPGLSGLEATYALLGVDPTQGLQLVDGLLLDRQRLDPSMGALVVQVYNRRVASQVKLALMRFFPDDHPVRLVTAASVPGQERVEDLRLFEIDRCTTVDHLTSLYVPPGPPIGLERLRQIVDRLRSPGGCPWDIEQTHESLRRYLIEEAFETVAAIDENDDALIAEELGDVLLQVYLQSRIAEEREAFDLDEVAEGICNKLIFRHPHVFGDVTVADSDEVLVNWDVLKSAEKEAKGLLSTSLLGDVPPMPALMYAEKVMGRAAKAGFDWPTMPEALAKVDEEWGELKEALSGPDGVANAAAIMHEVGDHLYALVNVARRLKIDPEDALRQATRRFISRFHTMEELVAERGQDWQAVSLEARKALWQEAKAHEKQSSR